MHIDGEDSYSIERHKAKLQQMYNDPEPNQNGVKTLMTLTFADRRLFVVSSIRDDKGEKKSRQIAEIVEQFPFLQDHDEVNR